MPIESRRTQLLALFAALAAPVFGQQSQLQFDVAPIRLSQTPPGRGLASLREDINTTPGNLTMSSVTLETCIRWAYRLQALLADRFKLTFHRQMKELSTYALVQRKGAKKLHPVEGESRGGAA